MLTCVSIQLGGVWGERCLLVRSLSLCTSAWRAQEIVGCAIVGGEGLRGLSLQMLAVALVPVQSSQDFCFWI